MLGARPIAAKLPGRAGVSGDHRSRFGGHHRRRRVFIGWNARSARGAHGDVKMLKGRLPSSRAARNRAGLWSLGLIVLTLLALSALVRG